MLIFRPEFDSHGKKDVTYAFKPEAEKFAKAVGSPQSNIIVINNRQSMAKRQQQVLAALHVVTGPEGFGRSSRASVYDGVAFFCHGWKTGLQLGFRNKDVELLARYIQSISKHDMTNVPLYCCSTAYAKKSGKPPTPDAKSSPGEGDNSFADLLRDALCAQGAKLCRVMGHTTVAHTTKNPHVIFFDGMGTTVGGAGGYRPVGPRTENWKAWKRELRKHEGTLRFRFPFMTVAKIHAELEA
jgi:hypothetical protein